MRTKLTILNAALIAAGLTVGAGVAQAGTVIYNTGSAATATIALGWSVVPSLAGWVALLGPRRPRTTTDR